MSLEILYHLKAEKITCKEEKNKRKMKKLAWVEKEKSKRKY